MTLGDQTVTQYLTELSSRSSTPGGGAVAALTGAQAAALIRMVGEFSDKTMAEEQRELLLEDAAKARSSFITLADQDATNFAALMTAYKNKSGIQEALKAAATPPLSCLEITSSIMPHLETLVELGNPNLVTDTGIAASLLTSTIEASIMNVLINLRSIRDPDFANTANSTIDIARLQITNLNSIANRITNDLV